MEKTDARITDIRESVAARKPVPVEDMADWLLRALTGGDVREYAEDLAGWAAKQNEREN